MAGRHNVLRKGCWTKGDDELLKKYVGEFGEGNWKHILTKSGLNRCPKSCRLRWINYLRPNIKRGEFALDEEDLIIRLHRLLGNKWSLIAGRIPGRTANDIKNYWNSYLSKKIVSNCCNKSSCCLDNKEADHHHQSSNINLKPPEREEEDEQDIASFWRSLLVEGDNLENKMTVENKEMMTEDDELFEGLEDFLQDIEVENKEMMTEDDELFEGLEDFLPRH